MRTWLLQFWLMMSLARLHQCKDFSKVQKQVEKTRAIAKFKHNIMKILHVKPIPPVQAVGITREKTPPSTGVSAGHRVSHLRPRTASQYKIWSEPNGSRKGNSMNFDMTNLPQFNVSGQVVSITLVVRLRSERKPRRGNSTLEASRKKHKSDVNRKLARRKKPRSENSTVAGKQSNERTATRLRSKKTSREAGRRKQPRSASSKMRRRLADAMKDRLERNSDRRRKRKNRKRRRKRGRKVKIVVRHLESKNSRKKRVSMKKLVFRRSDIRSEVGLSLPSHLLQPKAFHKGVLTLFVTCKRCHGTAILEQVYRRPKRGNRHRRGKSLNPDRPYIKLNKKPKVYE